jgi:hypothetical protein
MYGEVKPWGCKWFENWRQNIHHAVINEQRLQVFYMAGHVGAGKVDSWAACRDDAIKRNKLGFRRTQLLKALPPAEQARLRTLSDEPNTSAEFPGTERSARWDAEEQAFMASLPDDERAFLQGHTGLGNSQKAEVAWLDEMGYKYEEVDVRDFVV